MTTPPLLKTPVRIEAVVWPRGDGASKSNPSVSLVGLKPYHLNFLGLAMWGIELTSGPGTASEHARLLPFDTEHESLPEMCGRWTGLRSGSSRQYILACISSGGTLIFPRLSSKTLLRRNPDSVGIPFCRTPGILFLLIMFQVPA